MLSTSSKTKFQYQYLLIAVLILATVSVIALYPVRGLALDFCWAARYAEPNHPERRLTFRRTAGKRWPSSMPNRQQLQL